MVPKFSSTAGANVEVGRRILHPIATNWTLRCGYHFLDSDSKYNRLEACPWQRPDRSMAIFVGPLKDEQGTGLKYVRIVRLLSNTPYSSVMGLNLTMSPLPQMHSSIGGNLVPPRNISAIA